MTSQRGAGIVGYGAYVPVHRMERAAIATGTGGAGGQGARSVASFDEDTTTMGVAAGRHALAMTPDDWRPEQLLFATADPAYTDTTNATAIHAALRLDSAVMAVDVVGSTRNGATALRLAATTRVPTLVVAADMRNGMSASLDEREGGDAAAAVAFASAEHPDVVARVVGAGSATREVQDRLRLPGADTSTLWEDRFGEHAIETVVDAAVGDALKEAGVTADAIDHLVVVGPHSRANRRAARLVGAPAECVRNAVATIGNTGAAMGALGLCEALDAAEPDQLVALVSVVDGADVLLLRTTAALADRRAAATRTAASQISEEGSPLDYPSWLVWRGYLDRQPPRRPEPARPAGPPALRSTDWKFGFAGSACTSCGTRHLPPERVCMECGAVDAMEPAPMADVRGTIATFTIDRLTYSINPPVVAAVIDFDGGGRFACELTDVDASSVGIGDRVEMTFRRLHTSQGVHNYFWKARPLPAGEEQA